MPLLVSGLAAQIITSPYISRYVRKIKSTMYTMYKVHSITIIIITHIIQYLLNMVISEILYREMEPIETEKNCRMRSSRSSSAMIFLMGPLFLVPLHVFLLFLFVSFIMYYVLDLRLPHNAPSFGYLFTYFHDMLWVSDVESCAGLNLDCVLVDLVEPNGTLRQHILNDLAYIK